MVILNRVQTLQALIIQLLTCSNSPPPQCPQVCWRSGSACRWRAALWRPWERGGARARCSPPAPPVAAAPLVRAAEGRGLQRGSAPPERSLETQKRHKPSVQYSTTIMRKSWDLCIAFWIFFDIHAFPLKSVIHSFLHKSPFSHPNQSNHVTWDDFYKIGRAWFCWSISDLFLFLKASKNLCCSSGRLLITVIF